MKRDDLASCLALVIGLADAEADGVEAVHIDRFSETGSRVLDVWSRRRTRSRRSLVA